MVVRVTHRHKLSVLHLAGFLQAPLNGDLRQRIRTLVDRGERHIIVELAGVSRMDAAGVGELVRAYNTLMAAHGVLKIVRPTARVRHILERLGLFAVLSAGGERRHVSHVHTHSASGHSHSPVYCPTLDIVRMGDQR